MVVLLFLSLATIGLVTTLIIITVKRSIEDQDTPALPAPPTPTSYPLHGAVLSGNAVLVSSLLESGEEDVNARDPRFFNSTPLMVAIWNNHVTISELLLRHGANMSSVDSGNTSALAVAVLRDSPDLVDVLLRHGADVEQVIFQVYQNKTALSLAALCNHVRCARVLLQAGASMSMRFADGQTLVQMAAGQGHDEMMGLLLAEERARAMAPVPTLLELTRRCVRKQLVSLDSGSVEPKLDSLAHSGEIPCILRNYLLYGKK